MPTSSRRRWLAIALPIGGVTTLALAYLLLAPTPVQPVVWSPTPVGSFTPTAGLVGAQRTPLPSGHGPEDIHVYDDGSVLVGDSDGNLWHFIDGQATLKANTGGRPLGLHALSDGRIGIADAFKGLLAMHPDGTIDVLATECDGKPLVFTDDLDVTRDGTIYFTDASQRFDQTQYTLDIVENGTTGRLCRLSPWDQTPTLVLDGLAFANGVAIDPAQQFVLVNETSRYRVTQVWIDGPKAGTNEVLIDGLPGFNDGISAGEGRFWIAIAAPRNPLLDTTAGLPWLRKVMMRLPSALQPAAERSSRIIAINADGEVVADLNEPGAHSFTAVTSVEERDGKLYLGSLTEPAWGLVLAP